MENLTLLFQIVVSTVIAVSAVFSVLLVGVNALLNAKLGPIREKLAQHDIELKALKEGQVRLNGELKELKEGQVRFNGELRDIKSKLDQLLAKTL